MRLVGFCHHQPATENVKDIDEAVAAAFWAYEDNTWAPDHLEADDGTVILTWPQLQERMHKYEPK